MSYCIPLLIHLQLLVQGITIGMAFATVAHCALERQPNMWHAYAVATTIVPLLYYVAAVPV